MFHEPVFSIFMASVALAISLLVWNVLSSAGPPEVQVSMDPVAAKKAA